ncbi:hypothetical protein L9F63_004117, partial [Diploptera punctata]
LLWMDIVMTIFGVHKILEDLLKKDTGRGGSGRLPVITAALITAGPSPGNNCGTRTMTPSLRVHIRSVNDTEAKLKQLAAQMTLPIMVHMNESTTPLPGTPAPDVLSTPFPGATGVNYTTSNTTQTANATSQPVANTTETVTNSTGASNVTTGHANDFTLNEFKTIDNKTLKEHNITNYTRDHHQYYNSSFIVENETVGSHYWVDMNHPSVTVHEMLSQSHRRAVTVKLSFDFPFYGHVVRNVTVATGGFLYTGEYVHSWLAATQYIAPLMANFDTSISNESFVKYMDNGTAFTVLWEKVVLQDKPNSGNFTFQATLHKNGDIIFVYQNVPIVIKNIQDDHHPVKVGLSDAYIIDRTIFFVRRKTIYEYHRVNFERQDITNWTVIILNALQTCVDFKDCDGCLSATTGFQCLWCPLANRCSTGTDRNRQDWLNKGCDKNKYENKDQCPAVVTNTTDAPSSNFVDDKTNSAAQTDHSSVHNRTHRSNKSIHTGTDDMFEYDEEAVSMGISGIIGILFIIALVACLGIWALYAYRNPHTASGQFLIRYRPSQWSWKRGEARYTAATIHM